MKRKRYKFPVDSRRVRWVIRFFFCLVICTGIFLNPKETGGNGGLQKVDEYKIKALLVIRFAQFAQWPPHCPAVNPHTPFTIGVCGGSHIIPFLKNTIKKKQITIKGKKVEVIKLSGDETIKRCCIIFFSQTPKKRFDRVMKEIENLPILTIGNGEEYEKKDVMIILILKAKKKIGFNVKPRIANKCGIDLTSKILRHAEKIIE